jgi:hypothetical protein
MRYGSIDSESRKSFVQVEYETAIKKIEILIYVIDEQNSLIRPFHVDKNENAKKLEDFKEYLRHTHTVAIFTTPDDLTNKIEKDIVRIIREKGIVIDEDKFEPLSDNKTTIELINKFNLMPKKFSGAEIGLIVEFINSPHGVHKRTCDGLRLTYRATLARRIKIIEPNESSFTSFQFLKELYAEDEFCDFLYTAETGKPYKIIAKLSFGFEQEIHHVSPIRNYVVLNTTPPINNLETGEKIESYIRHNPIEALILVKPL